VEIVGICYVKATNILLIVVDIDYGYKECVTDVIGSSALGYYQPARSTQRLHWTGLIKVRYTTEDLTTFLCRCHEIWEP